MNNNIKFYNKIGELFGKALKAKNEGKEHLARYYSKEAQKLCSVLEYKNIGKTQYKGVKINVNHL